MRIFKFGGASVKDAAAVKNVVKVLNEVGYENTLLVVSAMGKTTNAMEEIVNAYFENKQDIPSKIEEIVSYHNGILSELFGNKQHKIYKDFKILIDEINGFLVWNKSPNYNFVYDQIVGYGELISTTIISAYLKEIGIQNNWLDVRHFIKTDNAYRDTTVNWEKTQSNVSTIDKKILNITQGFLGSDDNNFTTTLGREGSDYTAAILAYCLNADSVTIWKDVPGVLNADPRYFKETQLLNNISYREAIELAFYGASVIHPKTLQPLQRKEIPLHVKSFINPLDKGTTVGKGVKIQPEVPCFIVKKNQVLMKLSSLDFSFWVVENNISEIFKLFHDYQIKVDLIQNSAISFSVCVDNKFGGLDELLSQLKRKFKVVHHTDVSLYTIRHFNTQALESLQNGHEILLEQRGKETVQLVVK